jgi:hypothetical protein
MEEGVDDQTEVILLRNAEHIVKQLRQFRPRDPLVSLKPLKRIQYQASEKDVAEELPL